MALQAQYLSNAFTQDFQSIRSTNNGFKDEQMGNLALNSTAVTDPNRSRKRNRDADAAMVQQFTFPFPSKIQDNNYQQNTEIDALIRLHNAEVRSGLEEIQKRHCGEFLQIFRNQAVKKITEKDAEIESLKRKQEELEARLNQVTAENQTWFIVANNSEALVSGLKASLDQVLRQNNAGGGDCHVARAQAEDAESCCHGRDSEGRGSRRLCKACGERDVSVLVVPCRHLCLCLECEPVSDTCPVCYGKKNVGLLVFME